MFLYTIVCCDCSSTGSSSFLEFSAISSITNNISCQAEGYEFFLNYCLNEFLKCVTSWSKYFSDVCIPVRDLMGSFFFFVILRFRLAPLTMFLWRSERNVISKIKFIEKLNCLITWCNVGRFFLLVQTGQKTMQYSICLLVNISIIWTVYTTFSIY